MRWQRGEVSGHDFASEPGVGQQRDHRLGEMPMPVRPKFSSQPLFGTKRSRDGSGALHSADSSTAAPPWKNVTLNGIEIETAETSETLEKRDKDWQELCAKLNEYKEKAKERNDWKRKYDESLITLNEEEIRHLKEVYNARNSKLSPDSLAIMNADTTVKAEPQELYKPSEKVAPPRVSSPANARNTIPDPLDTYLLPHFQETFERVAKATMKEIDRARYRSSGRIVPFKRAGQSSLRRERAADLTEPTGSVPSKTRVRSRVVDIRKDFNTDWTFSSRCRTSKGLFEHNELESCNLPPIGSNEKQHLIVENGLIMCLTETVVVVQITAFLFGGASVAQVIKTMKIQNDDRVETLILMIGTNDISRNPIPRNEMGTAAGSSY